MKIMHIWPYEECQFHLDKEAGNLHISTPWQKLNFNVDPKTAVLVEQALSALNHPPTAPSLALIAQALHFLTPYPLFYILPRPLPKDAFIAKTPALPSKEVTAWDQDSLIQLSRIGPDNHDPVSLISGLRRYYLLELLEKISDLPVLQLISKHPDNEKCRGALAVLVRQNHFVTASCEDMLTPAIDRHPACADNIRDFIKAERGHDKILSHALKSMELHPENEKVLPSTIALTSFFKTQAQEDILTFAFMVDIFERSSSGEHPLARVLSEKGFPVAAKAIQNHANINIEEEHHNEGLEIIESLGGVSEAHARRLINKSYEATQLVVDMFNERYKAVSELLNA